MSSVSEFCKYVTTKILIKIKVKEKFPKEIYLKLSDNFDIFKYNCLKIIKHI